MDQSHWNQGNPPPLPYQPTDAGQHDNTVQLMGKKSENPINVDQAGIFAWW